MVALFKDENEVGRVRKKPYRYRWPDDLRDEVLARLLELNRQRAAGEAAPQEEAPKAKKGRKKKGEKKEGGSNLF